MNLLEHTTSWYKGEIFEATVISIVGLMLVIISFSFWKLGKTPNAQAIVLPILIVGLLLGTAGLFMKHSNTTKMKLLPHSTTENQHEFAQAEKQRVKNFQSLYTYTKIGAAICFTLAIVIFFVTDNRHWQAIAIALILTGFSGLVIDYFSKERADIYYNALSKVTDQHYE